MPSSSLLSSLFLVLPLTSGSPGLAIEKRAGHKSSTQLGLRDCNLTGYTVLNRVSVYMVSVYTYYTFVVIRSGHYRARDVVSAAISNAMRSIVLRVFKGEEGYNSR